MSDLETNTIIEHYDQTLSRLKNRPAGMSFKKISDATGLSKDWLSKLSRDLWEDPGIKKIAKLNEYFSQKELDKNDSNANEAA